MRRSNKNIAIKRINKDIKELTECPLIGIGITQHNNSFFDYIVNIQLMDGIYKGLCLQLKMTFPDTYPIEPPEMKLIPGQIDHTYHHHIYGTEFCLDIFKNKYLPINDYGTGYNSSYTISSLLLQMQVFLSDPDFPPMEDKPSKERIQKLFENMNNFRMEYINEKGEQVTHTWKHPYPEMYFPAKTIREEDDEDKAIKTIVYDEAKEIKENLTCSVLKVDYLSDEDTTAFGYPVYTQDHANRYCPIPEMVSYEAFINHIQNNAYKLENYFDVKYKSSSGKYFNCWFPIYINEKHYVNNEQHIKNALTVIKHGCSGIEKYDFKPSYIVEVFPKLLNSMIEGMITKKSILSESFIKCYYHFILLFQKMCQKYKGNINQIPIVKNALDRLSKNEKALYFEDDILLLLFTDNEKSQAVKILVTNYLRENIKCVLKKKETKDFLVSTLLNQFASVSLCQSNNSQRIQFFQDFNKLDKWGDIFEIVNKNTELIKDFEKNKTKGRDLSFLPKKEVEYVEEDIDGEEKDFFADVKEEKSKCPIQTYNEYVSFYDYIKELILSGDSNAIFSKLTVNEKKELLDYIQDKFDLTKTKDYLNDKDIAESQLIQNKGIVDLLDLCNETSKRKFVEYVYSNNNKNKLLSIIYLAKKKFSDKKFMEELEEHYGVLLQWELYKAIDETKEAITNIKSFSNFCQRIGHPEYINNDINFIKNSLIV